MLKLDCPRKPILQQISVPSVEIFSEHGAIQSGGQERGSVSRSTSPAYRQPPALEKPLRVTDPRSVNSLAASLERTLRNMLGCESGRTGLFLGDQL